jgi:aldose 1-epimerase
MTHASTLNKIGNFDGKDVFEVELISRTNVKVSFLNYGALIRDWRVPLKDGTERHVVCGFDEFESYPKYSPNFGAIIGRVANRIGGSKFEINGKEYKLVANEGPNHLHGGPNGFGKRVS